ncbi:MAG: NTP transferase domain-containing protein, partial [Planctomycetota bacterium]
DDTVIESFLMTMEDLETRIVRNLDPSLGQTSSVRTAIELEGEAEGYLVHPVDVPGVESGDVAALLEAAELHPGADAIALSVKQRRAHPVLLTQALAGQVRKLSPGKTLRDLLATTGVKVHYVESENELLLLDVNTPEEYEAFRERLGR